MVTLKAQKQSRKNFIIVFVATIVITRFLIFLTPRTSFIYQDNFHHIFIGIAFLIIYFFTKHKRYSDYFLAIILGLIADQITTTPFYLTNILGFSLLPHSFWYYWSPYSLISTTILIIISIFIIKEFHR